MVSKPTDPEMMTYSLPSTQSAHLENKNSYTKMANHTSTTLLLNTRISPNCVFTSLLITMSTHDCTTMHQETFIIKCADDTTIISNITNNSESSYQEEINSLAVMHREQTIALCQQTKELIVDFRHLKMYLETLV